VRGCGVAGPGGGAGHERARAGVHRGGAGLAGLADCEVRRPVGAQQRANSAKPEPGESRARNGRNGGTVRNGRNGAVFSDPFLPIRAVRLFSVARRRAGGDGRRGDRRDRRSMSKTRQERSTRGRPKSRIFRYNECLWGPRVSERGPRTTQRDPSDAPRRPVAACSLRPFSWRAVGALRSGAASPISIAVAMLVGDDKPASQVLIYSRARRSEASAPAVRGWRRLRYQGGRRGERRSHSH
jgi:hypothetical protein